MSKIESVCVDHACTHEFNDRYVAEIKSRDDYAELHMIAQRHLAGVDLDSTCERLIMIMIDCVTSRVISDSRVIFDVRTFDEDQLPVIVASELDDVRAFTARVDSNKIKSVTLDDLDDAVDVDHTFDLDSFCESILINAQDAIDDGVDLATLVTVDLADDSVASDVDDDDHDLVIKIHNEYKIKFQD